MLADRLSALADDISRQKDVSLGVLVDTLREAAGALSTLLAERDGLKARAAKLEARLEIDHAWTFVNGEKTREEIPPAERDNFPDGIECRNETIKLLDDNRDKLAARLSASNAALADALGLLREVDAGDIHESDATWSFVLVPDKVLVDISALLAKHGKTEEAKT